MLKKKLSSVRSKRKAYAPLQHRLYRSLYTVVCITEELMTNRCISIQLCCQSDKEGSCREEAGGWMYNFKFIFRAQFYGKANSIDERVAREVSLGLT